MKKKISKIGFIVAIQLLFLIGLGNISFVTAACIPYVPLIGIGCAAPNCVAPICDTCAWCAAPAGTGIYNPVVSPSVGTGIGAVIIAKFIAEFLSIAFIIAGIVLLGMILFAGIEWMTAGGDQNKLKSAQGRLTNALIGFIIVVATRAILGFIAGPLGVPWLDTLKIVWPTP